MEFVVSVMLTLVLDIEFISGIKTLIKPENLALVS
jgi:hypothetical protein